MTNTNLTTKEELFAHAQSLTTEFETTLAHMKTSERARFGLMRHAYFISLDACNIYSYIMDVMCDTEQEETLCVEQMDKLYALKDEHNIEEVA